MSKCRISALTVALMVALALVAPAHAADPVAMCHKTIVKQLEKYKKAHLKSHQKCLDKENKQTIPGPCLDTTTDIKLGATRTKVIEKIAQKCQMGHLTTLGFLADCNYGPATPGIGGVCAALPVTTPTEFGTCMTCWKSAEFGRYIATIYASHAEEICGAGLDDTSLECAALGDTQPRPDQRDLGDTGENDCQRAIAKAAVNYLLKREKILENCLLKGGTHATCLDDDKIELKLAKAETSKQNTILKACNNRTPIATPPFCCRTSGNQCVEAATRDECEMLNGNPQEGRVCNMGSCDNLPGNVRPITWWETCPSEGPCPKPTLGDIEGLIQCVDDTADRLIDGLLCLQFPNAGACPGAQPTPCATATPVETATPTPTPTSTP